MAPGAINGDGGPAADPGSAGQIPQKAAATTSTVDHSSAGGEITNRTSNSTTSPLIPTITAPPTSDPEARSVRQHRAGVGKITARTAPSPLAPRHQALNSLASQVSSLRFENYNDGAVEQDSQIIGTSNTPGHSSNSNNPDFPSYTPSTTATDDILRHNQPFWTQIFHWLQQEKANLKNHIDSSTAKSDSTNDGKKDCCNQTERSLALDQLERILSQNNISGSSSRDSIRGRRKNSTSRNRLSAIKALRRGSMSDSDYADADRALPPSADVVLDNSKTLLFSGGEADDSVADNVNGVSSKEHGYWLNFKSEILKITHTLGLKGWRRIPLNAGGSIEVRRLSGALTNAVYVVSQPENESVEGTDYRKPQKLLLRIYGPQVEHLIDREHELRILRRLAKKNIGPSVLGIFKNGRFEEYYEATTLSYTDLRVKETSKNISKRMRELHEAIELLPEERAGGPTVWNNWDKWVNRCEQVITWLDNEITADNNPEKAGKELWRQRGYVCGVPWSQFRRTVEKYRAWLDALCGGPEGMSKRLVFAHNDTQYGNLLRLHPEEMSPLMLPANAHRRLQVIDFEYASANTRAFEFANHFTEWCYNYHDTKFPWACRTNWYPTIEEQNRFIRAYLKHVWTSEVVKPVPNSSSSTPLTTPLQTPNPNPNPMTYTSSPRIPPFNLDSQVPFTPLDNEPRDPVIEAEVAELRQQVLYWRIANSAQWVAWGIVQAKVPGLEKALADEDAAAAAANADSASTDSHPTNGSSETSTEQEDSESDAHTPASNIDNLEAQDSMEQVIKEYQANEAADEFDYLAYAQDRALFFWADILSLGLAKEDEFPEGMIELIRNRMIGR